MQAPNVQPAAPGRVARRDANVIRTSMPSMAVAKTLRLPRPTRIVGDYVNATIGVKSGFQVFGLEVGEATYRAVTWAIKSTVEIVGVTTQIGGMHYVLKDELPDYLAECRIVANGRDLQVLDQQEVLRRNSFHAQNFGPFFTGFAFPGENMYFDQRYVDAYALGTLDFTSLRLEMKLKPAFDPDTMEIVVMPHTVDKAVQAGFVTRTERLNTTFSGIGKHTYKNLPIADDLKDIWIMGQGITHVRFTVDGELLFDMDRATYEAFLTVNGRDISALNGEWFLDFHVEGTPRSLAGLTRAGELKRNALIKLDVTTTQAETPVEFLVTMAGIYDKIR